MPIEKDAFSVVCENSETLLSPQSKKLAKTKNLHNSKEMIGKTFSNCAGSTVVVLRTMKGAAGVGGGRGLGPSRVPFEQKKVSKQVGTKNCSPPPKNLSF